MTQTIDISALLAPLDGERPHGEDVREHPEHSLTYFGIKDARNKARELERRAAFDDEETQTEPADWSPILRGVPELLKGQTKDLELAAWLLEALVRKHGFAGMRDGLHLACGLVQQYWPDVYPAEDEDGIRTKVNPLLGLNGNGATGALVGPILEIALTEDPGYSTNDYKLAQELENDDPEVRERRIAQGAASLLDIESRVKETSVEFFQELCGEIDASIAALGQLTDELNTRCGNDDGGYPIVGTFRNIAEAIETVRGALMAVAGHYLEPEAPAEEAAEDAGGGRRRRRLAVRHGTHRGPSAGPRQSAARGGLLPESRAPQSDLLRPRTGSSLGQATSPRPDG